MRKNVITSFDEFNRHSMEEANESAYNIPPGISDPGDSEEYGEIVEPEIEINAAKHALKIPVIKGIPTTDFSEMAILKDSAGTLYLLQFDGSDSQYDGYKNRISSGYEYDEDGNLYAEYEYTDLSPDAVEAIANDIPGQERGEGMSDLNRKDLVKLDGESAEQILTELDEIIAKHDAKSIIPYEAMRELVDQFLSR